MLKVGYFPSVALQNDSRWYCALRAVRDLVFALLGPDTLMLTAFLAVVNNTMRNAGACVDVEKCEGMTHPPPAILVGASSSSQRGEWHACIWYGSESA